MEISVEDDFDKDLKPRSKPQIAFHSLPQEIQLRLYGGAAGGGKSHSLVTDPLYKKVHQIYGFQAKFWRRSYPQIKESLWPEMQKWYPRFGFVPNETNHSWTHPRTKATISCGFLDRDADALKHDSAAFDYLSFEELTQFTEFMFRYLFHRNRPTVANWKAYCNCAATPGDIGNAWVRKLFVEPAREGYRLIEGSYNGKIIRRIFIPALAKDNPVLMHRDPEYIHRLEMLPEAVRRAKLLGDWWAFQGQVFEEFRAVRYSDEPDYALHVIEPFPIPDWWPKIISIDWGFVHGNAVTYSAVSPRGELIVYRDYLTHYTPIKIWGAEAKRLSQFDGNIVRVVADPVVFNQLGAERTLAEQITEATGWPLEPADNDRIGGKLLLHELFRWKPKGDSFVPRDTKEFDLEYSQALLRLKGTEAYHAYVKQFQADNTVEVLPKFKIFNTCTATIDAIQSAVYDEGTKNKKAEDVKKVDGDDAYDSVRYNAKAYEGYISQADAEYQRRCEVDRINAEVAISGDWNTYYNRLAIIAEKNRVNVEGGEEKFRRLSRHVRTVIH